MSYKIYFIRILIFTFIITTHRLIAYSQSIKIVDTGQTTFYNNTTEINAPPSGEPFYGQDA